MLWIFKKESNVQNISIMLAFNSFAKRANKKRKVSFEVSISNIYEKAPHREALCSQVVVVSDIFVWLRM